MLIRINDCKGDFGDMFWAQLEGGDGDADSNEDDMSEAGWSTIGNAESECSYNIDDLQSFSVKRPSDHQGPLYWFVRASSWLKMTW